VLQVLLLDDAPRLTERVRAALHERGVPCEVRPAFGDPAAPLPRGADVAMVVLDPHLALTRAGQALALLERLAEQRIPALVWGLPEQAGIPSGPLLEAASPDVPLSEVVARLGTLVRYGPLVKRLERELENVQRLGNQLNRYFAEIDQELRLAGRLQRDFLPARLPQVPPLTFAALYRPASWVSGDMYDAFRIDERHVGLFLTDAMGHGIAAGLLTMFLRQALVAKRINGRSYQVVSPAEAMGNLNDCLVRQKLPNCQFVTAVYGIVDVDKLELRVARGGHPYPIHVAGDGTLRELPAVGGLLGIADLPADFGETRIRLAPGDKIILYSDGVEDVFFEPPRSADAAPEFTARIRDWARLDVHAFVRELSDYLDNREGSLNPADDVTILAMQVAG
jgi:sigma-B regulation protein RsbU (phosphoserine phosphatase)